MSDSLSGYEGKDAVLTRLVCSRSADGHLFPQASETDIASLRQLGLRWQSYVKKGTWIYEQAPFWITGWTYWDLKNECPDLWLHLCASDLVIFKG